MRSNIALRAFGLGGALLLTLLPAPAGAQRIRTYEAVDHPPALPGSIAFDSTETAKSALGVFLASAVLPGAGQYRLGAGRWVAYAAIETWAWVNWIDTRREANDLEVAYRDLAWSVARRISQGRRQDREFEYYESMSHFAESGSFDAEPGTPGLQPEADESTFNGSIWALARAIYFPALGDSTQPSEAARLAALDYYERNAIGPEYAWSWGSNQLEHEHFRSLIRDSDEAARAGTTLLGVILVNHVVSAVDALLTARLRGADDASAPLRLRSETMFHRGTIQPFVVLEIRTP